MSAQTFDCRAIMKEAWKIVRRFLGNGETLRGLLARALRSAWFKAKQEQAVMKAVAAAERERRALAARPASEIGHMIVDLENRDRLGHEGLARLADLRAAFRIAKAREEDEAAARELSRKRNLIALSQGRICAVTFIKKDGSERVMKIQPAALKPRLKGEAASEASRRAAKTRADRHPHLLPVWDAEARAPRSVNLATVSRIAVNGQVHRFPA